MVINIILLCLLIYVKVSNSICKIISNLGGPVCKFRSSSLTKVVLSMQQLQLIHLTKQPNIP
uniref:Uncharacterized protein n=1 Tax=Setaria viridis TaxID=4556 RepID=A0A4U6UWH6_SETVI|nr:hypothetical protein SEVIR_5G442350v2 [Setaria viridis]